MILGMSTATFILLQVIISLAPNGNEPAFLIAQLAVLAAFLRLGIAAVRRFHLPGSAPAFG